MRVLCPHVDDPVLINTGEDEEPPRAPPSTPESAQAKDDGSLVLLCDLDHPAEREGEGEEDHQEGEDGLQESEHPPSSLTSR